MRVAAITTLALLLAACGTDRTDGTPTTPRPEADPLSVEVLAFDPGDSATGPYAALSEEPIHWPAFAGWFGGGSGDGPAEPVADTSGTSYLAAADLTGCRAPDEVRVRRSGDDLSVEFVGGTEHETCVRAFGPTALLAVRSADVAGVRTINGAEPNDPAGPGRLAELVELGTTRIDETAVELGSDQTLYQRLANAGVDHLDEARAALEAPVPAGERGFAFVLAGCAETGAVLLVTYGSVDAELTGGEDTACDTAVYFLATFTANADDIPKDPVLGGD